ncbi:MAG: amidohydrolase family protein [Archaeoglobus sp.]|nr:amidohydrolase family protein [Archaeoglobus sp.]
MIIDSHIHIGPSLALNTEVTPSYVVKSMEKAGVGRCLVFPFPSYGDVYGCEWVLEICEKYPFFPVFYVTEKFELPDERFVAVKWHWVGGVSDSYSNYDTLNSKKLPAFAERVAELGMPVIFEEELKFTSLFVEKYPEVKLIIPHLGLLGGNPLDFLQEFRDSENVYFDTALASPFTIKKFVEELGSERILYGSDVPFGEMWSELSKVKRLELNKKDEKRILFDNVVELCGLKID